MPRPPRPRTCHKVRALYPLGSSKTADSADDADFRSTRAHNGARVETFHNCCMPRAMMLMRCHHDVDRDGDGGAARWLSGQFGVLEVLGEKHKDLPRYL